MNKYLEKIAETPQEDKPLRVGGNSGLVDTLSAGLLAHTAIGVPHILANQAAMNKFNAPRQKADFSVTKGDLKSFIRKTGLKDKVNFTKGKFDQVFGGAPGYLHPHGAKAVNEALRKFDPRIKTPFDESIGHIGGVRGRIKTHGLEEVLHELGHAKDFNQDKFGLKTLASKHFRNPKSPVNFGLGAASLGMLADEDTRAYAPAVAAVRGLSNLREEIAADHAAYKHLGAVRGKKYLKNRIPGLATYAMSAAAAPTATYLAGKMLDHVQHDD